MASEEKIFEYLFANLVFQLSWQPIKFSGLDKIHMVGRGLLKEHICKSEIAINANFHFSHCKSMATIRVLIRLEQNTINCSPSL